jgi:hypothetical protein
LTQELDSATGDIPRIRAILLKLKALGDPGIAEEIHTGMGCIQQGITELFKKGNPKGAYILFQTALLGTGESEYSKCLTHYFRECLEDFCAHEITESYVDNFNLYIDDLIRMTISPEYWCLHQALSCLIREARDAGCWSEAIRLQKEMIFFTLLEGPQPSHIAEHGGGDYHLPLEKRLEKGIRALRRLMEIKREISDK